MCIKKLQDHDQQFGLRERQIEQIKEAIAENESNWCKKNEET